MSRTCPPAVVPARRVSLAALPLTLPIALSLALAACASGGGGGVPGMSTPSSPAVSAVALAGGVDSAAFVTRLGVDTIALEQVVRDGDRIEADVTLRIPRTARTRYVMELSPKGELERMTVTEVNPATGAAQSVARETYTRAGDSLRIEIASVSGERRSAGVLAPETVLPFVDMVHWPYEVALIRARANRQRQVSQPLLTGGRVSNFRIAAVGADSMTITHPTRGAMRARVDASGRLLGLDARETTRKLSVERTRWLDPSPMAARWAAQDQAGRGVGELSGRARPAATVHGARIEFDHGTPAARGRAIWGALVPFGAVWRTGANQATGFSTDRDLVLGTGADTLVVPAGRYTLFSIPERDFATLIVNRQTGQAGTAYDATRDLGRVRMRAQPLAIPVEVFTIAATEVFNASGQAPYGELRLQWDRTEYVVPFRVRVQ